MAQNVSVKQYLIGKGHDPGAIGWDNVTKTAKIDGVDFYKPPTIINGSSYDSQQNLDAAYQGYTNKLNTINKQRTDQEAAVRNTQLMDTQKQITDALLKKFSQTPTGPSETDNQFSQLIGSIMQQVQNPAPVDPYSTPQYAAAQQQSQLAAQRGIRANQEAVGQAGFGRSTTNTQGAQMIQNDADQQLLTQVVPMIAAQLQAERQQKLQNQLGLLSPLQTERQNTITNQRNELTDYQGMIEAIQSQLDSAYNRSPDNPLVKGQMLSNEAAQLELEALPKEIKAKAAKLLQEVDEGKISLDVAKLELKELTDPNSFTNQKKRFDEEMLKIDMKNLPEIKRLELEQLRKTVAQIGAKPSRTAEEVEYDKIKLDMAREELKQIQNKSTIDLQEERKGMADSIRLKEITPAQALKQINEDEKLGFYTKEEAAALRKDLDTLVVNVPAPEVTPGARSELDKMPSDKEIDKLAPAGVPRLDWRTWYKSPQGRMAGVSFENFQRLYGPKLEARK